MIGRVKPQSAGIKQDVAPDIFISTSCLSGVSAGDSALLLAEAGAEAIEFSGGSFDSEWKQKLAAVARRATVSFHNYYPSPESPFVLNLASMNDEIFERSIQHSLQLLDLAEEFGASQISLHAGFAVDPNPEDLGGLFPPISAESLECAAEKFKEAILLLDSESRNRDISLLIENNVLIQKNLGPKGVHPLLLVDLTEIREFFMQEWQATSLLLDLGHLGVSYSSLGKDALTDLPELLSYSTGLHLSDNDLLSDSGQAFTRSSWFWSELESFAGTFATVEVKLNSPSDYSGLERLVRSRFELTT